MLHAHPAASAAITPDALTDLRVLRDALPPAVDLSRLLDRRVRVTRAGGVVTVSEGGHVWVVVGVDQRQCVHHLDELEVRAAASQRPGGLLMIGTRELQWLLDVGEQAKIDGYVLHVVSRGASGVTYAIVDQGIWRENV